MPEGTKKSQISLVHDDILVRVQPVDKEAGLADVSGIAASIALFALSHALAVATCFMLFRRELDGGLVSAAVSLAHFGALTGCILIALDLAGKGRPDITVALGAFCGYLLPLAGLALGPWSLLLTLPLAMAGAVLTLRPFFRRGMLAAVLLAACGMLSGLMLFLSLNGLHYAHLFAYEFTVAGWQAGDTVFHAAIAALFTQYGAPTVGLDGTPFLFYHVGSHIVVSAMSETAGENVLLVYPAVQQIFFIPALLFGSALLAASFASFRRDAAWVAPLGTVLSWHLYEWFGAYNSFWLSESYAMSLGLFAFGFPMLVRGPGGNFRALVRWSGAVALIAFLSVAAKFTIAFAWALAAAAGLFLARREADHPRLTAALSALALIAYAALLGGLFWELSAVNANGLFAYANTYPRLYQVSLGAAALGIAAAAWLRLSDGGAAPSPFMLLAFVGLLHLPDVYLNDGAGGAYYWFHPGDHVAAAVAVAALVVAVAAARRRLRHASAMIAAVLATAIGYSAYNAQGFVPQTNAFANTLVALDRLSGLGRLPLPETASTARSHEYVRQLLAPERPEPWSARDFASFARSVRVVLAKGMSGMDEKLTTLIEAMPLADAARQARHGKGTGRPGAFIEPGSAWRWAPPRDCTARNYAFQALSGVALVAGIPEPDAACPAGTGFGLGSYGAEAVNRPMDDATLCAAAAERALRPVVRLSPEPAATPVDCGAVSRASE